MAAGIQMTSFWQEFTPRAARLGERIKRNQLQDAFTEIESLLGRSGYEFAFELTHDDDAAVLILTPEGNREEAARIDELLGQRPDVPGWRFYGRRQRKDPDDAMVFVRHIYDVDINDARFTLQRVGDKFDVTMFSNAMRGMSEEERKGLVMTFLDHAVGEEQVMQKVREMRGAEYPLSAARVLNVQDAVAMLLT